MNPNFNSTFPLPKKFFAAGVLWVIFVIAANLALLSAAAWVVLSLLQHFKVI